MVVGQRVGQQDTYSEAEAKELRLAAAGWLGGFGNPPPSPPPGWLAGWRAPGKQSKYVVHHCTASSHAWCAYGDGFARVGGVGHLSRTPLAHKDQEHET